MASRAIAGYRYNTSRGPQNAVRASIVGKVMIDVTDL